MAEPKYPIIILTEEELTRIFSRISVDPDTSCWNWTGGHYDGGYGAFCFRGKNARVHRLIYAHFVGDLPPFKHGGLEIDHICNNPKCCNPDHLRLISHRENTMRGRSVPANNGRKTHCKRGHLLPEVPNRHGFRQCMACVAIQGKTEKRREQKRIYRQEHRKR